MNDQELTPEEEAVLAPVSFTLVATVNGVTISSRAFIRESTWNELPDKAARDEQIEVTLQEMAKAVSEAVHRDGLAPEAV